MVNSQDMMNNLNLNIEKTGAQKPDTNPKPMSLDPNFKKQATLKVTDTQQRINQIREEIKLVNQEIINLQNAQRDLIPNNPSDPNNAKNRQVFMNDQKEKMGIQQAKLKALTDEVNNLQKEITRNKNTYL